jgi:tetratricopeptide (TPR) repeat protein
MAWFGRDSSGARVFVARMAVRAGDWDTALANYEDAFALSPKAQGLRNDLAWMLATSADPKVRRPEVAVRLAESLVREAEPPDPNWLDTLAAAYAAAGRFEEAMRTASQAAALAQEQGESELGEQIRARLALYRARRVFVAAESPNGA